MVLSVDDALFGEIGEVATLLALPKPKIFDCIGALNGTALDVDSGC